MGKLSWMLGANTIFPPDLSSLFDLSILYECIIFGREKVRIADVLPRLFPYFANFLSFSGKKVLFYAILITLAFKRVVWWRLSRFLLIYSLLSHSTSFLSMFACHGGKRKGLCSRAFALWMRG